MTWGCLWALAGFLVAEAPAHAAAVPDAPLDRWFAAQARIQNWSADFTQTRSLKVLAQPLISTGKVWVAAMRFRWELGQPAQTIAIREPAQLTIIYPRLKRAERYPLAGVPAGPVSDAFALMDASLPRDRAAIDEKFRVVSAVESNAIVHLTLQPKSESARKIVAEIALGLRAEDFAMVFTSMKFADGSRLRNDFTNVILNTVIPAEHFEVHLPQDFKVSEPLRQ